jgi:thiol-disulfide isomerase/thioredoxin
MGITSSAQDSPVGVTSIRLVKNPVPLPQFSLKTLDGKTLAPDALKDKVVLVNFWATWCAPCLDEMPNFARLASKYADHLQVVGLSLDYGSPESVSASLKSFAQHHGINYPLAIASPQVQSLFGGILGLPTSFLLDRQGRVVQKHVGFVDPEIYEAEIRALIGLPIAAKIEYFEDYGEVFPVDGKRITRLPGVDLSKLTPERKEEVLRLLGQRMCPCGCRMTLTQCRIIDPACPTSLTEALKVVAQQGGTSTTPSTTNPIKP